ncbi:BrnT family toxin [Rhizobium sp. P32RR-XVIII]|uniref:BrnT family toxin n=1 Tax=Rhizobium sp. P32RR-XVIII TaxID=2726738 RepID=UPI0014568AA1|nr:BrnT family toxin [Rhizobium sp. P32RR-XVIII]NLS04769.1 BrnT family toxin [Rhizobium sp. P32RR-XVIII]
MLDFEWDADKDRLNRAKHGVSFDTASLIWDDPNFLMIPDAVYETEQRWLAIGRVGAMVVLVAVHSIRPRDGSERIRIISARRATSHERKRYEQATFD